MNLLKSILQYRCPRCRTAKLFKVPFNWASPLDMPDKCSVCHQDFEPEPGFYYGAMFVSYALSILLFFIPGFILVFGYNWQVNHATIVVILISAVSFFKILRLSRSIWIHINVSYKKQFSETSKLN